MGWQQGKNAGRDVVTTSELQIERRAESQDAIQRLMEHRTEMLSLFGELASKRPFNQNKQVVSLLQNFCQALVDYTADAHFRLYRFIDTKNERRKSVAQLAERVYPRIVASTETILDFNDKYDSVEHSNDHIEELEKDLSSLGERLADRIEMEDRLVDVLLERRN
jgi:regulator of sigma D